MSLIYYQSSGILSGLPGDNFAEGYSGHGDDRNVPDAQSHHGTGPIPRGRWKLGAPYDDPHLGPRVFPLTPEPGTETFGRSGFFIHGDSGSHPGQASHGCPCFPHPVRDALAEGDIIEVKE